MPRKTKSASRGKRPVSISETLLYTNDYRPSTTEHIHKVGIEYLSDVAGFSSDHWLEFISKCDSDDESQLLQLH